MTVTRTGSVTVINATANSGSQSVTVPADAELMVCGVIGSTPDVVSNFLSGFPPTIGGAGMTLADDRDDNDAIVIAAVFVKASPATGSQTFAWNWSGSNDMPVGGKIFIAFYKGVDTSSPVGAHNGAQDTDNSATTGSLTATSGDAVFAVAGLYNSTLPTCAWTNATELNDSSNNSMQGSFAEAFPSGNVTITATHSGGSGGSALTTISAIVINQGAASTPLTVQDAAHTHISDAIALTTNSDLTVTDATHTHATDDIALTVAAVLAVDGATHEHAADAITLGIGTALAVQDATHTHAADTITLSTNSGLTVTDATHTHAVDVIALTVAAVLAVDDATHEHAADAITLSLTGSESLTVQGATHTHAADTITLSAASYLAVDDATHEQVTDPIILTVAGNVTLTVQDATHTHAADAITLSSASYLAMDDATHEHAADGITLVLGYGLTVSDASHEHAADAITLASASTLGVQDATHTHTTDAIVLDAEGTVYFGRATLNDSLVNVASLSDSRAESAVLSNTLYDDASLELEP